jgi:uncharacterized RDD family membrane protein YckC
MQWYYAINGQRQGPVSESDIERLAREGVIQPDTLVWRQGLPNWQPFSTLASTFSGVTSGSGAPGAPTDAGGVLDDTAICAVSGKRYPKREMIQYEGKWISAEHRDAYFQRLNEGGRAPGEVAYGGFWIRFVAYFIDGLIQGVAIIGIYLVLLFTVFKDIFTSGQQGPEAIGTMLAIQGVLLLAQIVIGLSYSWFFLSRYSATPGKMALGLKVVRADGSALSTGRIVGRYFGQMLSSLVLNIGFIIAAFDDQKRGLHDHICDTRVIKTR